MSCLVLADLQTILKRKVNYDGDVLSHSVVSDSLRTHRISPPGSSVHGILQARILEWVAMPFSMALADLM